MNLGFPRTVPLHPFLTEVRLRAIKNRPSHRHTLIRRPAALHARTRRNLRATERVRGSLRLAIGEH
jgi:hypothetical protein